MQVGTLVLDDAKPPKAVKLDRRCDELVTSALEWHPDVIAWFDYETDLPPSTSPSGVIRGLCKSSLGGISSSAHPCRARIW